MRYSRAGVEKAHELHSNNHEDTKRAADGRIQADRIGCTQGGGGHVFELGGDGFAALHASLDAEGDALLASFQRAWQGDTAAMQAAVDVLEEFGVPHEVRIVSAHRTPDLLFRYAEAARSRGLRCIIAGAGGAAHLARGRGEQRFALSLAGQG